MEEHNKNSRPNIGSDNSIDLKSNLPDWLLRFFNPPMICGAADINDDMLEGYPNDDDF